MQRSKFLGAAAVAAATLGVTGVAFSAFSWTTSGGGSGSAEAHTQTIDLVVDNPTAQASLFPGSTGDVTFKLGNTNGYQVTVTGIAANGAITSDKGGCAGTNATFTPSLVDATGLVVASGATAQLVTLPDRLALSADAPNVCQGATFTVPVTVTITQSGS
jgi:hypothetical protein